MSCPSSFFPADAIRTLFSHRMSQMYQSEVPLYGELTALVAAVNQRMLAQDPALQERLQAQGELARINLERHGAIRVGTAEELATLRRLFAVMGMQAVGYYDLSVAGVPVHSTAFRPITETALQANPFRVFTSLLRLELIADPELRREAAQILARRDIFAPRVRALITQFEQDGGLTEEDATEFVEQALETFRWHGQATVSLATYERLQQAHRLIADVVCFRGPHINHLTPRTLDIDQAQAEMTQRGIDAKEVVEGPPRRQVPILLRQTSFKALSEPISFAGADGLEQGRHSARFGEIEQRGLALTRQGRALYDSLLAQVRQIDQAGSASAGYGPRLQAAFAAFPDDLETLRRERLGFFRYSRVPGSGTPSGSLDEQIARGQVRYEPITYEDFLPVSAAGIFQSNLGGAEQKAYAAHAARQAFEGALGTPVLDEIGLYEALEADSLTAIGF